MTILFLCSGNTCRSPMALAAWRSLERSDEKPFGSRVHVRSAGLAALTMSLSSDQRKLALRGVPASRYAQRVARAWGEDLSRHRAYGVSSLLVAEADLIITMTHDQAHAVRDYFGLKPNFVRSLGEFATDDYFTLDEDRRLARLLEQNTAPSRSARDIVDPYGGSFEAYQSCGEEIRQSLIGLRRALRAGEFAPSAESL